MVCKLVTCEDAVSASHNVMGAPTHALLLEGGAVGAEDEFLRGRSEVGQACNGQVLVVEVGVVTEPVVGLGEELQLAHC